MFFGFGISALPALRVEGRKFSITEHLRRHELHSSKPLRLGLAMPRTLWNLTVKPAIRLVQLCRGACQRAGGAPRVLIEFRFRD